MSYYKDAIKSIIADLNSLEANDKDAAQELVNALNSLEVALQAKLTSLGLDYSLYVSFGGYSLELGPEGEGYVKNEDGEWVDPKTGEADWYSYSDYERGDWVSSSAYC